MAPVQLDLILPPDKVVYRAYSRKLDEDGRVQARDFILRQNEAGLSVALTGEKAMDELDVRGYVPLTVRDIRLLGLDVVLKGGQDDADLLEIVNIPRDQVESVANSLAARAGDPIASSGHRRH